ARVRVHRTAARGLAAARNAGLDLARGAYIQLLDADDVILPTKLAAQLAALARELRPALAYCDYFRARLDDSIAEAALPGLYLPPCLDHDRPLADLATRWERSLSIPVHCFLLDRRLFSEHGIRFDERLPNHEDWDCWMEILRLDPALHYVDAKLAVYRLSAQSMSRDRPRMRRGFLRAIRKQRRSFRHDPGMRAVLTAKLADTEHAYRDCSPRGRAGRAVGEGLRGAGRLLPAPVRRRLGPVVRSWMAARGWIMRLVIGLGG
ncbi:MAG: glycosyltransferase, partial [Gemmatimonadales bacterium]